MSEPEKKQVDLDETIREINETIKSIDKSLAELAGSVDKKDGVFCIKGEVTTYREY